ncbi:F-box SKIP5 isoform B [Chlorella sorokiniana]|jgi:hypothetical protein|uniref:F-box SKIP5 isoform A n=1 Tax=Chlorella sorokiniana TaxID=3076 RepID=A0A2P6U2D6_CHLSO|nr:F-box SKIP5 isoform A [Chlorella sorokiniana]PRW60478.1 F-box SKIP5 isoform B [Chlorella sorokiniana]|eukprot:PRW60477.1 F-box SKIP5 isoform A [Chlorella sorokiniana]
MEAQQPASQLCDLDDHLLLQCFSHLTPLPDLFNVAAACRRFRDLALDRRTWLYVTHAAPPAAPGGLASPQQRRTPRHERPHQPPPARAPSSASLGGLVRSASAASAVEVDDSPHWYRQQFCTLAEAVAASRPGDTILLEAGPEPHVIAAPVVVRHPVHILGGGAEAGDCVLAGAKGIEALIDFRASGRLANLTLRATASACVAHTKGRATVQGCTLECDARGLPHLAAPLLTRAVSRPAPPPTPAAWAERPSPSAAAPTAPASAAAGTAGTAAPLPMPGVGNKRPAAVAAGWGPSVKEEEPAAKRLRVWRSAAEAAAGAGVLSVVETRIRARGAAVDLRGSGRLSSVRAIYSTGHALVWLEVDSANTQPPRSSSGSSAEAAAAAAAAGGEAAAAVLPGTPAPSWLSKPFNAAAFQARIAALTGASQRTGPEQAGAGTEQAQQGLGDMERKAEEWCVHHHSSLAPAAPADGQQHVAS